MTIRTKTAKVTFKADAEKITCVYDGLKDDFGGAVWFDADGRAYHLSYARRAKVYAFIPYPAYDR